MTSLFMPLAVFSVTYILNMFYITVLYHRGLAHGAVEMKPWVKRLIGATGCWVTGLDPKGWACMHRLHHRHSDTLHDPHSPWNKGGIFGVAVSQLQSYKRVLRGLIRNEAPYTSVVKDIDLRVSWVNRAWYLPYVVHAGLGVWMSIALGSWWIGAAYWIGLMSHPVQGWMVNALAHRYGYQTFDAGDQSRNNTFVAWFVFGEGYQNNHHAHPQSAKFSVKPFEFDSGYALVLIGKALGVLTIPEQAYVPKRPTPASFELDSAPAQSAGAQS